VEIAAGNFKTALQTLKRLGVLLETDARLPSVASLIAGEAINGSWWSHPAGQRIFATLGQFEDHPDVMFTKLISGKVTLVHRNFWPEMFAIGSARASWQMDELSRSARDLLKMIDERGSLTTDKLEWPKSATAKPGDAARELERKLVVHAGEFHTESGAHAKLIETWKAWAQRVGFSVRTMQIEKAMQKMEERVRHLNEEFGAKGRLPWA
jgi:hypothetical protein